MTHGEKNNDNTARQELHWIAQSQTKKATKEHLEKISRMNVHQRTVKDITDGSGTAAENRAGWR